MMSSSYPQASIDTRSTSFLTEPRPVAGPDRRSGETPHREHRATVNPHSGEATARVSTSGRQSLAAAYTTYNFPASQSKDGWTPADNQVGTNLLASDDDSPVNMIATPSLRYGHELVLIAHRGLVDQGNGIPENSMGAIDNAVRHNINNVEIDVQATSDGVAVPLHDDSLSRPTGGLLNTDVAQTPSQDIIGKNIYIRNPSANPAYFTETKTGYTILSLEDMLQQSFEKHPGLSIILDPKSLSAAQAAVKVLAQNPAWLNKCAMKVYDNAAFGSNPQAAAQALASTFKRYAPNLDTGLLKIDPVMIPPGDNWADPTQLQAATLNVESKVTPYAVLFDIPQVEFGAIWNPGWANLHNSLLSTWLGHADAGHSDFTHNDHSDGEQLPNIGTYYRFEDYAIGGQAYDYNLQGQAVPDNYNVARRTAGGLPVNEGWVTTDVPLQEDLAHQLGWHFGVGNANVDF